MYINYYLYSKKFQDITREFHSFEISLTTLITRTTISNKIEVMWNTLSTKIEVKLLIFHPQIPPQWHNLGQRLITLVGHANYASL